MWCQRFPGQSSLLLLMWGVEGSSLGSNLSISTHTHTPPRFLEHHYFLCVITKVVFRHWQVFPQGQNHLRWLSLLIGVTNTGRGPKGWAAGSQQRLPCKFWFWFPKSSVYLLNIRYFQSLNFCWQFIDIKWWHLKFCFTIVSTDSEHFLVCLIFRFLLLGHVYSNLLTIFFLVFFSLLSKRLL